MNGRNVIGIPAAGGDARHGHRVRRGDTLARLLPAANAWHALAGSGAIDCWSVRA
jgi:hypothetical protein